MKVSLHICSNEFFLPEAFETFNICHSFEKSGSRGVTSYEVDYIVGGQGPLDPLEIEGWITPDTDKRISSG